MLNGRRALKLALVMKTTVFMSILTGEFEHGYGEKEEQQAALEERAPRSNHGLHRRRAFAQAGQTGRRDARRRRPQGAQEDGHLRLARLREVRGREEAGAPRAKASTRSPRRSRSSPPSPRARAFALGRSRRSKTRSSERHSRANAASRSSSYRDRPRPQLPSRRALFSVLDFFDKNTYSGDLRQQFFNMAFLTYATYDFGAGAADASAV